MYPGFSREDILEAHKPDCCGIGQAAVRVEIPAEGGGGAQEQAGHHKQFTATYFIYIDFEGPATKLEGSQLNPTNSNTQIMPQLEAYSYCYMVVHCDGQTEPPVEY